MGPRLGEAFQSQLSKLNLTVDDLYRRHTEFFGLHDVAERLLDFDERVHLFRFHHLKLAQRIIGGGVVGTMGTPVEVLHQRMEHLFYKGTLGCPQPHHRRSHEGTVGASAPARACVGRYKLIPCGLGTVIAAISPPVYNQTRRAGVAQW